jgi:hypothetical protein
MNALSWVNVYPPSVSLAGVLINKIIYRLDAGIADIYLTLTAADGYKTLLRELGSDPLVSVNFELCPLY